MPLYRPGTFEDAEQIAQLHTSSWQLNYRGILDDYYLDHEALADRRAVWKERLRSTNSNMSLLVAEEASSIIGFGCLFLEDSDEYGAYLDNLHVISEYSGRGIGKVLMSYLAQKIVQGESRKDMYLWVLRDNLGAIRFYEKLGGQRKEQVTEHELGNSPVEKIRFYWPDVSSFIIEN